ncbi:MAG: hypothetical protein ACJ0PU_00680 [Flavobacteriaceae bacterium]
MKTLKTLLSILFIVLIGCSEEEPVIEYVTVTETVEVEVQAQQTIPDVQTVGTGGVTYIEENQTWTNDRIWLMDGKIVVRNGATLTIEAGTIVKAETDDGADATVLVIAKGGKINAVGTADDPIIFTDNEDQIGYDDNGISPNRIPSDMGKWGSIVVLGNSSTGTDTGEAEIEGIATGYDWTTYGGSDDSENSGNIEYVSIRHSGKELNAGEELQGLTLGGVGNGTTVQNVEIVGSKDDGIEIFGGSVDVTNLFIYYNGDDAIDLDQAYKGTISNAVVIMNTGTDNVFEFDGTEDSTGTIDGAFTVQNVTAYGNANAEKTDTYGHWKSDATCFTTNVVYKDFITGTTIEGIDSDTYGGLGTSATEGSLLFSNLDFVTTDALADIFSGTSVTDFADIAEVVTEQADSTGADETVFAWTLYSQGE